MEKGTNVVCIDDNFYNVKESLIKDSNGLQLNFPVKDEHYTIREVFSNNGIVDSVLLEGIYNPTFQIPVLDVRRELSFASWRFSKQAKVISLSEVEENEENLVLIETNNDRFKKAANTGRSFSSLV